MARQREPEVIRARATRAYEAACDDAEKLSDHSVRMRLEDIRLHFQGYAEPGYADCPVIATGNWNAVDEYDRKTRERKVVPGGRLPERLGRVFEALGVPIEWCDEWADCDDCGKLVRTQPDWMGWEPHYVTGNGELFCSECAKEEEEEEEEESDDESDCV